MAGAQPLAAGQRGDDNDDRDDGQDREDTIGPPFRALAVGVDVNIRHVGS
jgi:hypothetical protein